MILNTNYGEILLPTFFPDGTIGVVRGVDSKDLESCGVEGLVVSTFHLLVHGAKSNLHKLMNWQRPLLTDSGGFQVFSLLRNNSKSGKVSEDGFAFNWNGERVNFTPEESIRLQLKLGADILICLDQCTDPEKDYEFQKQAVGITIKWAKRCKSEFQRSKIKNQKLFAVIQGGDYKDLRKWCAEELVKIGFDGYCYGGWPVDKNRKLLEETLDYTAKLMPSDKPKYALGVGTPEDIIKCAGMGYGIFDCVIPTREARHKRFYVWKDKKGLDYSTLSLNSKYAKDIRPLSKFCDCHTCKNFSSGYLHHLFKIGDTAAFRLATIHNLRFYAQLMERLKSKP